MKKIMYTKATGGVYIVTPASKEDLERVFGPMTEAEYHSHVMAKSIPSDAHGVKEIDDDEIPEDRYFRGAWVYGDETKIKINMESAREIHMGNIRKQRDKALKALDIEAMKGNDVQDKKQALRDLPETFDINKAKTPEELKNLWPLELKDYPNSKV